MCKLDDWNYSKSASGIPFMFLQITCGLLLLQFGVYVYCFFVSEQNKRFIITYGSYLMKQSWFAIDKPRFFLIGSVNLWIFWIIFFFFYQEKNSDQTLWWGVICFGSFSKCSLIKGTTYTFLQSTWACRIKLHCVIMLESILVVFCNVTEYCICE